MTLKTRDGIALSAEYAAPRTGAPVFILMHGLGAGKEEWRVLRSTLSARGWGSLALDARGHGESGGPPFRAFSGSAAWTAIDSDFDAALRYVTGRGIPERRVVFAGASLGANLAARAAVRHPKTPFVLLLSAGEDYQGVLLAPEIRALGRPFLAAASRQDAYALRTASRLAEWGAHPESVLVVAPAGHGVGMLTGEGGEAFLRKLMGRLEAFVETRILSSGTSGRPASP